VLHLICNVSLAVLFCWLAKPKQADKAHASLAIASYAGHATPSDRMAAPREAEGVAWCRWRELNPRPWLYESPALPLSYNGGPGVSAETTLRGRLASIYQVAAI
jgi:hypothetical protein